MHMSAGLRRTRTASLFWIQCGIVILDRAAPEQLEQVAQLVRHCRRSLGNGIRAQAGGVSGPALSRLLESQLLQGHLERIRLCYFADPLLPVP